MQRIGVAGQVCDWLSVRPEAGSASGLGWSRPTDLDPTQILDGARFIELADDLIRKRGAANRFFRSP